MEDAAKAAGFIAGIAQVCASVGAESINEARVTIGSAEGQQVLTK
jgi:hypothetical protein